jgi:metal iron transporter
MNCPSRTEPSHTEGWNQSPNALNADATTVVDLNHMVNARLRRDDRIDHADALLARKEDTKLHIDRGSDSTSKSKAIAGHGGIVADEDKRCGAVTGLSCGDQRGNITRVLGGWRTAIRERAQEGSKVLLKYAKFIGPGFMVAVAYIDPGRVIFFIFYLAVPFHLSPMRSLTPCSR